eukprot:1938121-Prymnesium_polylepis.3
MHLVPEAPQGRLRGTWLLEIRTIRGHTRANGRRREPGERTKPSSKMRAGHLEQNVPGSGVVGVYRWRLKSGAIQDDSPREHGTWYPKRLESTCKGTWRIIPANIFEGARVRCAVRRLPHAKESSTVNCALGVRIVAPLGSTRALGAIMLLDHLEHRRGGAAARAARCA